MRQTTRPDSTSIESDTLDAALSGRAKSSGSISPALQRRVEAALSGPVEKDGAADRPTIDAVAERPRPTLVRPKKADQSISRGELEGLIAKTHARLVEQEPAFDRPMTSEQIETALQELRGPEHAATRIGLIMRGGQVISVADLAAQGIEHGVRGVPPHEELQGIKLCEEPQLVNGEVRAKVLLVYKSRDAEKDSAVNSTIFSQYSFYLPDN